MADYYKAKRQCATYIENRLRETGTLQLSLLYYQAQRQWGFGKKTVDSILKPMAEARTILVDEIEVRQS